MLKWYQCEFIIDINEAWYRIQLLFEEVVRKTFNGRTWNSPRYTREPSYFSAVDEISHVSSNRKRITLRRFPIKSTAKIRTFSNAAKFILPGRGIVVFLQPEKRYNR